MEERYNLKRGAIIRWGRHINLKEALPNVEMGASMKTPLYLEGGHYKKRAANLKRALHCFRGVLP